METVNKLFVSLHIEGQEYEVGELIISERKIYFRYNSDFIFIRVEPVTYKASL